MLRARPDARVPLHSTYLTVPDQRNRKFRPERLRQRKSTTADINRSRFGGHTLAYNFECFVAQTGLQVCPLWYKRLSFVSAVVHMYIIPTS